MLLLLLVLLLLLLLLLLRVQKRYLCFLGEIIVLLGQPSELMPAQRSQPPSIVSKIASPKLSLEGNGPAKKKAGDGRGSGSKREGKGLGRYAMLLDVASGSISENEC